MKAWACSATRPDGRSSSCSLGGPRSVGELAQQLPISRPAVSQHLRVLKDGGLVVGRAEGTRRVYRLNPDGVAALRAYLDRVWDEALTAFHKAAEAAPTIPNRRTHEHRIHSPRPHAARSPSPFPSSGHSASSPTRSTPGGRRSTTSARPTWPTAILEPHEGGRWYERGADGSECDWGRVLVWEPPHRLVVTWQINGQWQYDPDPEHASEIEVRFTADGPGQTIVELEHRLLERLVDGQALHDGISGGGGWISLLERFAKAATNQR